MPFTPKFITEYTKYKNELSLVHTLAEWRSFEKKWLDEFSWPLKSSDQIAAESEQKGGLTDFGGRSWAYTSMLYDITAEARYEWCRAVSCVGNPLKFASWNDYPKLAENGWHQECPYCEISTSELGEEICPKCGRKLIFENYS